MKICSECNAPCEVELADLPPDRHGFTQGPAEEFSMELSACCGAEVYEQEVEHSALAEFVRYNHYTRRFLLHLCGFLDTRLHWDAAADKLAEFLYPDDIVVSFK